MLGNWLRKASVIKHEYRVRTLLSGVRSLLDSSVLALTNLGRSREGTAETKHKIKATDRLLGNHHLHAERNSIYREMAMTLLATVKNPIILVDWADTGMTSKNKLHILKAAVPVDGRAIPVYEEVYTEECYNNARIHRDFLKNLQAIIPATCKPVIVTDAGFKVPWFQDVVANGWDFLGRVRGESQYLDPETGAWTKISRLYEKATTRVRRFADICLTRSKRFVCDLYLVRGAKQKKGQGYQDKNKYKRMHKTPWLLATSLPPGRNRGRVLKQLYTQRMQIEENIRDLKSHRFGFGLRTAYTKRTARAEILLLIAALATFSLWLLGLAAKAKGIVRHFQVNTIRDRAVLSVIFLGKELWRNQKYIFTLEELSDALEQLKQIVCRNAQYI